MTPPLTIIPVFNAGQRARAPGEDSQVGFVIKAWLDSFQYADAAGPLPMDIYFSSYRETLKRLLGAPGVELSLAVNETAHGSYYGFICWMRPGRHEHHHLKCGAPVLLYVYVKAAYRQMGIANALLGHAGIDVLKPFCFPFKSSSFADWGKKKWLGGLFRPLIFRFPLAQVDKETTHAAEDARGAVSGHGR